MNCAAGDSHPRFTPRQGQYLAFIHAYTLVNERPPAQADIQRFFRLTPPSVYQMLLTLERDGLISRRAGVPRSIAVLVDRALLPALEPARGSTGQNHCAEVLGGHAPSGAVKWLRRPAPPRCRRPGAARWGNGDGLAWWFWGGWGANPDRARAFLGRALKFAGTAEIRLRAGIRIGELVRELESHQGARELPDSAVAKFKAVEDAGLNVRTAQRYEELAGLRDEQGQAAGRAGNRSNLFPLLGRG